MQPSDSLNIPVAPAADPAGRIANKKYTPQDERVALLVVPSFQGVRCPGLGISQLQANLEEAGFPAEVLYLNLRFAERITPELHDWISGTGPYLLGELIFSHVVHERTDAELKHYVDEVLVGSDLEPALANWFTETSWVDALRRVINEAREFIQTEAIDEVLARDPWLVGLSSTFQSNCCSLAVIREIKKRRPDIITVMGGANCEAEMGEELMACYPEVDFVGRGECDRTFVEFVSALQAGEPGTGIEGFLSRDDESPAPSSRPLNGEELDANPHPNFGDYFAQLATVEYSDQVVPGLAIEASRGCWWGAKQHCTFCGFNRLGMVYRSKSPSRVLEEMNSQVAQYGIQRMEWNDNILELDYFKTLLPQLAEQPGAEIFCEIKVNLSREQIQLLRRANFRWLQPGVESLSDKSLKLMRKGTSQLQNIQTFKWCTEVGIELNWIWLFGFPGEDEEEVETLASVVEAVHHLAPPECSTVLFLERFAPYHTTPDAWGIEQIRPAKAYAHVYPFPDESLQRLAFFFDCGYFEDKEKSEAYQRLQEIVDRWKTAYSQSHLLAIPRKKSLILLDTRSCAKRLLHRLTGLRRRIYEYCSQNHPEKKIVKAFQSEANPDEISLILKSFVDDFLMLESDGRYLSLATEAQAGYKDFPDVFPGGTLYSPKQKRTKERRRKLLDAVLLRIPPPVIANAVKRRLINAVVRQVVAMSNRSQP